MQAKDFVKELKSIVKCQLLNVITMFWTNIKRIVSSGFMNFWRNGVVTFSSVLVMTITIFGIGSLIFLGAILNASLQEIQDKVDVNVYFKPGIEEKSVLKVQEDLESLSEVKETEYISESDALENFKIRHSDDQLTLQALEELDENPLGAMISVTANETSQYENIASFLKENYKVEDPNSDSVIDKINFFQNQEAIERLSEIIDSTQRLGFAVIIALAILSVMIMFNTTRLAIYTAKDEIAVMRLVGASDSYIKWPFVVEGFMHGTLATVIALILFYPLTAWMGSATGNFFGNINVFDYYISNFGEMFFLLLACGVFLGGFSSFLSVRRYLKS